MPETAISGWFTGLSQPRNITDLPMLLRYFTLAFLSVLPLALAAQEVTKKHNDLAIWSEAEATFIISSEQYFVGGVQFRHSTDRLSGEADPHKPWNNFEDIRLTLGYEQKLGEKFRAGISQRISFEQNRHSWYTRVGLRHKGKIGSVLFIKRTLFEHIRPRMVPKSDNPNIVAPDPENRIRFSATLEKPFKLWNQQFSLAGEYEILFDLGNDNIDPETPPRRIDRTRLQAEFNYFIDPRVTVTAFAIKQTRYRNLVVGEDSEGNKTGGKTNTITPIIGLILRYNINTDEIDPERYRR